MQISVQHPVPVGTFRETHPRIRTSSHSSRHLKFINFPILFSPSLALTIAQKHNFVNYMFRMLRHQLDAIRGLKNCRMKKKAHSRRNINIPAVSAVAPPTPRCPRK